MRLRASGTAVAGLITVLSLIFLVEISGADDLTLVTQEPQLLEVGVGKSLVLQSQVPIRRMSVANPAVADIVSISTKEIYVSGKAAGITTLTLWSARGVTYYSVEVSTDTTVLKQKLHELLPDETQIRVTASPDAIMLSGRVSNEAHLKQALSMAKAYAGDGEIQNLLEVGGVQQVMLEVKVSEMQKAIVNALGVNWAYIGDSGIATGMIGGLMSMGQLVPGSVPTLTPSSSATNVFSFRTGNATQVGVIEALREEGLLKLLAEPTLIALSGQEATILVGGEYPIPVPQGLGTVAIDYKEFGVIMQFTPTVLADNRISLVVQPEVSELDFTNAARVEGYVVPALTTRRASTVVELADGQSYAIAGLLKDNVRDKVSKYPFLGEIPILGNLFRSRNYQSAETELVIVVTPHLVKTLDAEAQTLPTDFYVEPDYFDFFVLGNMTGRGPSLGQQKLKADKAADQQVGVEPSLRGEPDGDFGHAIPMVD